MYLERALQAVGTFTSFLLKYGVGTVAPLRNGVLAITVLQRVPVLLLSP